MGDPISLASGLLALTTFALQSSKVLYETFKSFRNNARNVRELNEELESLENVLVSLHELVDHAEVDLNPLKLPVLRCGKACEEFANIVRDCTARSAENRTSFRDWLKLSYMGQDIAGFRNLIAGYKSTIAVALADANIRTVGVTIQLLREYKELIDNTTCDLQELLQQTNNGARQSYLQQTTSAGEDAGTLDDLEQERTSIRQCLEICKQVSAHLDQVQMDALPDMIAAPGDSSALLVRDRSSHARFITKERLKDCKRGLGFTINDLESRLDTANKRLAQLSAEEPSTNGVAFARQAIGEEVKSIKQCLAICEEADEQVVNERINVFEDITLAEDGQQIIVATLGDLIAAKRVSAGARSTQWLGQMSDASLQKLSEGHKEIAAESDSPPQVVKGTRFEGMGRKLT